MTPKLPPLVEGDGDERHGTMRGYTHGKCRCALCREARRLNHRAMYPPSGVAAVVRPYIRNRKRDDALAQTALIRSAANLMLTNPDGDAA